MASDPGGRVSGACHELLRRAFNSLDIRTGGATRWAPSGTSQSRAPGMLTGRWGPAHLARRRLPPPHRCVRFGPGCATGPPADSGLQSVRPPHVGEPHRYCKQMQLYRVRRHDAAVLWLFNHLATRRRTTVIYEQKVWVDTEARNQKPDLFLPDLNRAIDVGIVRPEAMGSYYAQKIKACSTRTMPVIVGTNGTLHPSSATHRRTWASTFPNSWPSPSSAWSISITRPL